MKLLNLKKMPLTSVGSFLAILIFLISLYASSQLYNGSYSILNNWISDLGNSTKNPTGYIYFDIGCILTGIAIIISAIGLAKWKITNRKQNYLILLSQYCEFLMAFALIMVGIFSEDYGRVHYVWASIYFILLFVFLIIVNITLKSHPSYIKWIWYYTFVSIFINFIFMFTVIIGFHIPILEWLAVLSGLLWIGLIGYNTLKLEKPMI
ncbi:MULTISPECIES: DUF998 domain-containing protein [Methanosarcina]|uniref:DUF998 domain-containing protein n=2 Tax=Methanosarcina barkeri TaxID=2208 RepID=A0A0E3LMI0_METBA|nr:MULTISPECIES: DUF998 domain-containing protein [Methanosarcina]AKB53056.1 hypothetical protein MSBRM_0058 [Methanosarcina barkeri MS]AKB56573.1 hypothetical protein MSBR2_0057 [Methanosarcina barkeri 227]OED02666.1 hypothetical protein A9239_01635 [Methanosarcina sp. A14]